MYQIEDGSDVGVSLVQKKVVQRNDCDYLQVQYLSRRATTFSMLVPNER